VEITSNSGKVQIALKNAEVVFLAETLEQLKKEYEVPPDSLESKVAGVWYSNEGHLRADSTSEEEQEWNQELFNYRSKNAQKIEAWIQVLRQNSSESILWEIPLHEVDVLLVAMNDYRLCLAARYEVAETEMEHDLDKVTHPEKRYALLQIHLLGLVIENILGVVN
jgi:hypothetical protein